MQPTAPNGGSDRPNAESNATVSQGLLNIEHERYSWCEPVDLDAQNKTRCRPGIAVRIIRCSTRKLDKDNLYGGVKYLVDALRYAGLIPQDTPDAIDLDVTQRRVRKDQVGTIVEIIKP